MRFLACLLACSVLATSALAVEYSIAVNDTGYWLTVTDANGAPQTVRVTSVVDARTGAPNPNPEPPPPSGTIESQVEGWAREIGQPTVAAGIAEVYRISAEQYSAGKVDAVGSRKLVSALTDEVLNSALLRRRADQEAWQGWRDKVTLLVTSEVNGGTYGPHTLTAVETGLIDSTDDMALGDGVLLAQIIELIKVLLPFILQIIGGL